MRNQHYYLERLVENLEIFAQEKPTKIGKDRAMLRRLFNDIYRPKGKHISTIKPDEKTTELIHDLMATRKPLKAHEAASSLADYLCDKHRLTQRLVFEDESFSLYLDGEHYHHLDPIGYWVIKMLAAFPNQYMTSQQIVFWINDQISTSSKDHQPVTLVREGAAGKKRIDRAVSGLPEELQALLYGKPGCGRMLRLP